MAYNVYVFASPEDEEPLAVLFDDPEAAMKWLVGHSAGTKDIIRIMDMDTEEWIPLNELRKRIPGWPYVEGEPLHNYWYKFSAHNEQTRYGFGNPKEAEEYCDILNEGREINLFQASKADVYESRNLKNNTEAFNLDDELAARKGLR